MSATRYMIQLLDDAALGAGVYPLVAPQTATLPFLTLASIHEGQEFLLAGATSTFEGRMSIACHAASAAAVNALAEDVKLALQDVIHREITGGSPAGSLGTATIWKEGTDVSDYSDDRTVFRRTFDWRIRWERPE